MKYRLPITDQLPDAALIPASGLAVAGEIYKWTGEDGNVHYEDRPVGKTDMEHVDVVSRNTDNTVVQARLDGDREARAALAPGRIRMHHRKMSPGKRYADRTAGRARKPVPAVPLPAASPSCAHRTGKLYKEDNAGEREYLSEDEIMAARSRVEYQIQEYCGA